MKIACILLVACYLVSMYVRNLYVPNCFHHPFLPRLMAYVPSMKVGAVDRLVSEHLRTQRRLNLPMLLFLCSKNIYSPPPSAFDIIKIAQSCKGMREHRGCLVEGDFMFSSG
jgi:hypothetical protein